MAHLTARQWLLLPAAIAMSAGAVSDDFAGPISAGRAIYAEMRGQDQVMASIAVGAFRRAPETAACAACHGETGEGGREGGIVAPALVGAGGPANTEMIRWLSEALVAHRSANGRRLDVAMPRYRLSDRDLAGLAAYVGTFPNPPIPGVSGERVRIAVDIAGSRLSAPGAAALRAELEGEAKRVATAGGIFGREVVFDSDGHIAEPFLTIRWNPSDTDYALSLRPSQDDAARCGSVDPAVSDRLATVARHIKDSGRLTVILGGGDPGAQNGAAGNVAIVADGALDWRREVAGAASIMLPSQLAEGVSDPSLVDRLSLYAPGDLQARTATARELMTRHGIEARDAMVVAVYREAAELAIAALRDTGRRVLPRRFCDQLRMLSEAGQHVSIVKGQDVTVLPVRRGELN